MDSIPAPIIYRHPIGDLILPKGKTRLPRGRNLIISAIIVSLGLFKTYPLLEVR